MAEETVANPAAARALAIRIARCPEVARALQDPDHPCGRVAGWYRAQPAVGPRYHPEPWYGHLNVAPILFLASNPGAGERDEALVPGVWTTSASSDDEILAAADSAFELGQQPGVFEGEILINGLGERVGSSVRYWRWAKRIASELLASHVVPGRDYALAEVVHCGSRFQEGVGAALETCTSLYLDGVLGSSPARVVVAVGVMANRALRERYGIDVAGKAWGPVAISGRQRWVLRLTHPSAPVAWGLDSNLTAIDLAAVRRFIASER